MRCRGSRGARKNSVRSKKSGTYGSKKYSFGRNGGEFATRLSFEDLPSPANVDTEASFPNLRRWPQKGTGVLLFQGLVCLIRWRAGISEQALSITGARVYFLAT